MSELPGPQQNHVLAELPGEVRLRLGPQLGEASPDSISRQLCHWLLLSLARRP